MKKVLLLWLLAFPVFSQTIQIDSLKQALAVVNRRPNGYAKDTQYCRVIKAIMKAYGDINVDSSTFYNSRLIEFCLSRNLESELIYGYQYGGYLSQIKGDHHQSINLHYKLYTSKPKFGCFR